MEDPWMWHDTGAWVFIAALILYGILKGDRPNLRHPRP